MPDLWEGPCLDPGERLAVHDATETGRLTPRAPSSPTLAAERPGWNPAGRFDVVERQFVFSKSSLVLANGTAPVHVPSIGPGLSSAHAFLRQHGAAAPRRRGHRWRAG